MFALSISLCRSGLLLSSSLSLQIPQVIESENDAAFAGVDTLVVSAGDRMRTQSDAVTVAEKDLLAATVALDEKRAAFKNETLTNLKVFEDMFRDEKQHLLDDAWYDDIWDRMAQNKELMTEDGVVHALVDAGKKVDAAFDDLEYREMGVSQSVGNKDTNE